MTWVIAHRGASADERENTIPAFERAIELGADFVELDVQVVGRRRAGRLPRPRPRPADTAARAAPSAHARRAARAWDPDPRGCRRPDAWAHRRHGGAQARVPLPSARRGRADGGAARPGGRRPLVLRGARSRRGSAGAPRFASSSTSAMASRSGRRRPTPGPWASTTRASPSAASPARAGSGSRRPSTRSTTRGGCVRSRRWGSAASSAIVPRCCARRSSHSAESSGSRTRRSLLRSAWT